MAAKQNRQRLSDCSAKILRLHFVPLRMTYFLLRMTNQKMDCRILQQSIFSFTCAIQHQHDDPERHRQNVERRLAGGIGKVTRDEADDQTDHADEEQKDAEYHLSGHKIPSLPGTV